MESNELEGEVPHDGERAVTRSSRKVMALTAITHNVRLRNTGKAVGY
jgi:hypothetical protein